MSGLARRAGPVEGRRAIQHGRATEDVTAYFGSFASKKARSLRRFFSSREKLGAV